MPFGPSYTRIKTFTNGGNFVPGDLNSIQDDLGNQIYAHSIAQQNVHGIADVADLVLTDDDRLDDERTPPDNTVDYDKMTLLAQSSFVHKGNASAGRFKATWGVAAVPFSASDTATLEVPHGQGTTPVVVVATVKAAGYVVVTDSYDGDSFMLRVANIYSAVSSTSRDVSWFGIFPV